MKKLLALVLALVMTLSLCTVSNAAYSDAKDVDYKEAVDVMSAVGVFQGADGKFSPKAELTREQAAKLIAYLDLGESVAEALPAVKAFNDVEANRWSAKYVAYCADAGYLAGVGNNNFDPAGKLTGYAFGKMLLCVLGYDAAIEGFTGANWQIKVATLMESNDIAKSVAAAASATLTREAAAQYCLNALKADMVEYDSKGTNITINGAVIATGASKAKPVATTNATETGAISGTAGTAERLQLGEKLYKGDLKKVDDTVNGRDGYAWTYKTEDVGSFVADDGVLATSSNGTTFANLTTKGKTAYIGYKADDAVTYYVNGVKVAYNFPAADPLSNGNSDATKKAANLAKNVETVQGYAANIGTVVEFIDTGDNGKYDVVSMTVYTFSKITGRTEEKADGTEATITINATAYKESEVTGNFAELAKNDYVLFAVIKDPTNTTLDTVKVYEPTTMTGTMTKRSSDGKTLTIDGTAYKAAATTAVYFTQAQSFTSTKESTFYMDANGYIVAADGVVSKDYVVVDSIAYVTGSGVDGSNYIEAKLVFADGKTEVAKIKSIDGASTVKNTGDSLAAYSTSSASFVAGTASAANGTVYNYFGTGSGSSYTGAANFICLPTAGTVVKNTASNAAPVCGSIYTYSVDGGKYVLTTADNHNKADVTFANGVAQNTSFTANNKTTFLVKTTINSTDKWTVYEGYKAMPTSAAATIVDWFDDTNGVTFVYVDASATTVGTSTSDVAYFFGTSYTLDSSDSDNIVREYTAVLNGELKTVIVKNNATNVGNIAQGLFDVTLDENGVVKALGTKDAATDYNKLQADGETPAKNGVLAIDSATVNAVTTTALSYDGSETVYVLHTDSETITTGDMESIEDNAVLYVKTASKTDTAKKLQVAAVYVIVAD